MVTNSGRGRPCSWIPALALRARPERRREIFLPLERVGSEHPAVDLALAEEAQPQLFGNAQRARIVRMNIRNDAIEPHGLEAVPEHGQTCFGRKAVAPGRAQKTPADLDLGADRVIRNEQHPADEGGGYQLEDHGPIPEAGRIGAGDAVYDE